MLAGVKVVPRDQLLREGSDSDDPDEPREGSRSSKRRNDKRRQRKKLARHYSSDDTEGSEEMSKGRRKRRGKKRYSSGDDSDGSEGSEGFKKRTRRSKKVYSSDESSSASLESESSADRKRSKKKRRKRRARSPEDSSSSGEDDGRTKSGRRKHAKEGKGKRDRGKNVDDKNSERPPSMDNAAARKEMGLDWMLGSGSKKDGLDGQIEDKLKTQVEEVKPSEEINRPNPRELNPYFKDNGTGYPDDASPIESRKLPPPPPIIGDGGVSWRLKALKRAKEQAAREGRKLDEVAEERWGSLGKLAASVAGHRAAPSHAHLHAIKGRRGQTEKHETKASGESKQGTEERARGNRDYLRDVSSRHSEMRKPNQDSISWKRNKGQHMSSEDTSLISSAVSSINKFANDGNFMDDIMRRQTVVADSSNSSPHASIDTKDCREAALVTSTRKSNERYSTGKEALTANQLAAKVLQLRMKGKHDEAEKLSKEMEAMVGAQEAGTATTKQEHMESTNRYVGKQFSSNQKKRDEDADFNLAQKIMHNRKYSVSGRADDEYDFDDAPSTKRQRKKEDMSVEKKSVPTRFVTQQERCQFCFENPSRPKHLIISIANFTYMMLPLRQPVVEGHCCILPMQHDSATRIVDKHVWEELRNFKKCLLKMFARQNKDVVFLETVIDLTKQRRHCLIDCIPVPSELADEAPMYFKKAIDEAEEEWGQHEMKKVIPTSGNLRNVIPENFSYFHVEFGLDRGFVHVIDDESNFKSSFGLNVIRGMLQLPEEDMHRRRRHEPVEKQKQAVASFAKQWEPFDWTRQLG